MPGGQKKNIIPLDRPCFDQIAGFLREVPWPDSLASNSQDTSEIRAGHDGEHCQAQKQLFVGIQNVEFRAHRSVTCNPGRSGVSGQPRHDGGVHITLAQPPRGHNRERRRQSGLDPRYELEGVGCPTIAGARVVAPANLTRLHFDGVRQVHGTCH